MAVRGATDEIVIFRILRLAVALILGLCAVGGEGDENREGE
jgi:hypothetical protein